MPIVDEIAFLSGLFLVTGLIAICVGMCVAGLWGKSLLDIWNDCVTYIRGIITNKILSMDYWVSNGKMLVGCVVGVLYIILIGAEIIGPVWLVLWHDLSAYWLLLYLISVASIPLHVKFWKS